MTARSTREEVRGGYVDYQVRPEAKPRIERALAELQPLLNKIAPGTTLQVFETIRADPNLFSD